MSVDGVRSPELIGSDLNGPVISVAPDESAVILEILQGETEPDLSVARLDRIPLEPEPYLRAQWHEEMGQVSPDGRWLAYTADESGPHEVYLRSFPVPGLPIKVSEGGGSDSVWHPDGSAIFYLDAGRFIKRAVQLGELPEFGPEEVLFSTRTAYDNGTMRMFDIHPDGDRFLFVTFTDDTGGTTEVVTPSLQRVEVVVNWFEELRERMAGG